MFIYRSVMQSEFKLWIVVVGFLFTLLLTHVVVIGTIEWSANAVGGRVTVTVVGLIWLLVVYAQLIYTARSMMFQSKLGGVSITVSFVLTMLSSMYGHANVFFITALYGEAYALLPPITQSFDAYYRGFFPMTVGVFLTQGNASVYPQGVVGHLWWSWTAMVGWAHIGFILGFVIVRLTLLWGPKSDGGPTAAAGNAIPMDYVNVAALARIKTNQHHRENRQYSARRRNRVPTSQHVTSNTLYRE